MIKILFFLTTLTLIGCTNKSTEKEPDFFIVFGEGDNSTYYSVSSRRAKEYCTKVRADFIENLSKKLGDVYTKKEVDEAKEEGIKEGKKEALSRVLHTVGKHLEKKNKMSQEEWELFSDIKEIKSESEKNEKAWLDYIDRHPDKYQSN